MNSVGVEQISKNEDLRFIVFVVTKDYVGKQWLPHPLLLVNSKYLSINKCEPTDQKIKILHKETIPNHQGPHDGTLL